MHTRSVAKRSRVGGLWLAEGKRVDEKSNVACHSDEPAHDGLRQKKEIAIYGFVEQTAIDYGFYRRLSSLMMCCCSARHAVSSMRPLHLLTAIFAESGSTGTACSGQP